MKKGMKKTCVYFCSILLLFPCFISLSKVSAEENVNEVSVEQKSDEMREMLQEIDKNPNYNVEIDGDNFTITFSDAAVFESIADSQDIPVMIAPRSNGVNKIQGALTSGSFKIYLSKNVLTNLKSLGIGAIAKIIPGLPGYVIFAIAGVVTADKEFKHGRVFIYKNFRYQYWYNQ